jgi:hypothetical protein
MMKWKTNKTYTVEAVLKYNQNMVETKIKSMLLTQIYIIAHYYPGLVHTLC